MEVAKQRPTGITVLAVFAFIGGAFFALIGLLSLLGGGLVGAAGGAAGETAGVAVGAMAMIIGIVLLALGGLYLVFGYGAWTLKPWAWMLGMAAQIISIIFSIIQGVTQGNWSGQILPIVISAAIIYYLNTPAVKTAFGKT